MHRQRDIVLIPVPFSDLSSIKKRPVIVLSNDSYNSHSDDILVAAVTSRIQKTRYSMTINQHDIETGFIRVESMVRTDKIYSLNKAIVQKKIGRVKREPFQRLVELICELIELPKMK